MTFEPAIQICEKAEEALKAWIEYLITEDGAVAWEDSPLAGVMLLRRLDDDDPDPDTGEPARVTLPFISVVAEQAEERYPELQTGNWDVSIIVEVHAHAADTTRTELRRLGGIISATLTRSDVVSGINALDDCPADFTAVLWTREATAPAVEEDIIHRSAGILWSIAQ